ncbi:MAG: RHS repeat-associated core domain-containing protein, partial [Deltaproteobacteria bacterium]|nr:RHS repeat-associated core domain-containing protein [Deltaproteobacteria bacterium]
AARTTLLDRDPVGRVTTATTPGPRVTLLDHDENGNVTSITPPGRPAHTFGYSPVNFMRTEVAPDLGSGPAVTQNTYNLDRQLTQVTRPDGALVSLFYDSAGRLDHVTRPEGTTQYAYDPVTGHRVSETGPGGSVVTYAHDGDLLTSATWSGPVAASVQFGYDNFFRVTSRMVGGTSAVTVHHDDDGLLDIVGDMTLARDPQNGLLTGTTLAQVTETISYSPYGELASTSATAGATPLHGRIYTRDPLGRVSDVQETVAGVTVSFHYDYDPAGHLTDVTRNGVLTHHFVYDANGNRTSQTTPSGSATASYDDRDRLLALGGTVYTYTANGEIATRNEPMIGVTELRYDSLGRLVGATLPDARVIDYVLDPAGRRIGKKVNGVLVQGFVYGERITPVAELDGAGNVVAVFVYSTGRTSPDYIIKGANRFRVLADHVGTPRLIVDTATGAVVAQMEHDVFGNVVADSNPGFQPFGFAGGVLDRDTGLVHMGAREYDPASGRFTSVDPLSFGGGDSNLYAYVGGDAVNKVDPTGLFLGGVEIVANPWTASLLVAAPGIAAGIALVAGAIAFSDSPVEALDPRVVAGVLAPPFGSAFGHAVGDALATMPGPTRAGPVAPPGPTGPADWCEDDEDPEKEKECDKEIADAKVFCREQFAAGKIRGRQKGFKNKSRGKGRTVGGNNWDECMAGQVSERCRGNLVSW